MKSGDEPCANLIGLFLIFSELKQTTTESYSAGLCMWVKTVSRVNYILNVFEYVCTYTHVVFKLFRNYNYSRRNENETFIRTLNKIF